MLFPAALRRWAPGGAEGRFRSIAAVTALGVALASGPAWAAAPAGAPRPAVATQPGPMVMVWPGEDGAPVEQAEAALRAEGVAVVSHERVREALASHRAARAEREQTQRVHVEAALEAAQDRYLELDFDAAIDALHAVADEAAILAGPGRCDGLWELAFRLGLAYWADGNEPHAREHFELALALDPERRPPTDLYGPDVAAAFLRAVSARAARFSRPMSRAVQPADASVEIDCRPVDEWPVPLVPGAHAVRVTAPGYRPSARVAYLHGMGSIHATLESLPVTDDPARRWADSTDADAVDDGSRSAHALVLALAREHGAEAVLVIGRGETGVRVRPWGRDGIGDPVELSELPRALRVALGSLTDDGRLRALVPRVVVDPVDRPEPRPEPRTRRPVHRTWWLWTIVGGVAAGTALGLGLGLGLREPAPGRLVIVGR